MYSCTTELESANCEVTANPEYVRTAVSVCVRGVQSKREQIDIRFTAVHSTQYDTVQLYRFLSLMSE